MKKIDISEYVSENDFSKQIYAYIDASSERLEKRLQKDNTTSGARSLANHA